MLIVLDRLTNLQHKAKNMSLRNKKSKRHQIISCLFREIFFNFPQALPLFNILINIIPYRLLFVKKYTQQLMRKNIKIPYQQTKQNDKSAYWLQSALSVCWTIEKLNQHKGNRCVFSNFKNLSNREYLKKDNGILSISLCYGLASGYACQYVWVPAWIFEVKQ